jgi:uncharacterized GH25 family protein
MVTRIVLLLLAVISSQTFAHDTWVETNTNLVRTGDAIYIDLKLGNHGNEHRDFKIAGKVNIAESTLKLSTPGGKTFDLKPDVIDTGYAPKEGYWSAKFSTSEPGLYLVGHTLDQVVTYAPMRTLKSAKTFFVVSNSLDRVPRDQKGFDRVLGHPLELVPISNPVVPMGPGQAIQVKLLFEGKPLADSTVSFVPRGHNLKEGFDAEFERKTDALGIVSFAPKTGNVYLVVAHHQEPRSGANYESTKFAATLTLFVPEICPCCE